MNKNLQNKNMDKTDLTQDERINKGFFKKVWYSINKIETYSELSAEGFGTAIKYLVILIIILSIISAIFTVYMTSSEIKDIANYIDKNSPELTYNNEILSIDSKDVIIDDDTSFGKVIIDTKTEDEEKINQYINNTQEDKNAVIILKDRLILKEIGVQGIVSYNYKELFKDMGIIEFNKSDLVSYLTGSKIVPLYFNLFFVLFIYAFIIYMINTLINIFIISIVGYLVTIILKLRIKYVAVFNMAVYSITLSTILDVVYIVLRSLFRYAISYFDIMYILVASIYMMAAIFILKVEFNKKQGEVQKIVTVEEQIKEEIMQKEKQEDNKEDKEKNKNTGKKKKNEESKNNLDGEEPEGSNA